MEMVQSVNVKNRGTGEVGYVLPDTGLRRNWSAGEVKKNIPVSELEQLTFIPGGTRLIEKYLLINDETVCEYLGLNVEPEYFYDEAEVVILLTTGTEEQLLDCLEFAPTGVIDLIKKLSVSLPLNDMSKRGAILKETGFDVTAAISNVMFDKEVSQNQEDNKTRRAKPLVNKKEDNVGERRASTLPNYNIVKK